MNYTYDPTLVTLSIATALLGAFTPLVVMAGINRVHASEMLLRILLAAVSVGSGIWATNFVSLAAEAITLQLPNGMPLKLQSVGPDYPLALSTAGVIYAICGLCIGIFALVGLIKRAGPGGPQGTTG